MPWQERVRRSDSLGIAAWAEEGTALRNDMHIPEKLTTRERGLFEELNRLGGRDEAALA